MSLNLYERFAESARRRPGQPAILGPSMGECLSYSGLDEAARALSEQLRKAGVRPGDCVGLHCPSGALCIVATYAVWRCGGCVVPIPVELAAPEKEEVLRTIRLPWALSPVRTAGFLGPLIAGAAPAMTGDLALLPLAPQCEHPAGFHDLDAAFIRFTSGTTGAAKGVVLSHQTIRERIDAANEVLALGPGDRVTWVLSMSYHFAVSIVAYLTFGAGIVLPANHLAAGIVEASRRHGATVIYASPAHYAWLAAAAQAAPLASLRLAVSTTARLDRAVALRFQQRFGLPLTQALGIIEVGLPFINTDFAHDRPEGIGRPLPAYRLRLEDTGLDDGLGEVLLSGKGVLDAYYAPWRPRAEVMPDGWFRTGDVAEADADGCLFLRGRKKDVISVLGMKFFPQEVEAALAAHPRVDAACVVAWPDARLGEVVRGRVVLRPGGNVPSEAELLEHCRQRLADYKVPQQIEFVSELPRTASGKLLHRDAPRGGHP
jgi:long-chain acyl-CoA synthetase